MFVKAPGHKNTQKGALMLDNELNQNGFLNPFNKHVVIRSRENYFP